ncbi:hypothetical protein KM914_14165 [Virgibacillus pantothenticus]|uniref:hypothetical protein n=2 Tax=Virgibacillus TaxID=84406 RepID=UPI001C21AECA|nr:hypothetical protein [Virgibacillus pantothenticus]MBU8567565.1 hypothetical protein [Virgibacillus pantothenticus]MBU8601353.1 hypothetical protein [Virgibacillus pantothenticus]MBU8636170.1 hypothetical protein [Virgibacillus pantothenticus]MBU8643690.1 hypothetical protein [Virgibacillus pantothenticus]MBU8648054.1 hypothetical protein [Virgibacillus pantothenticus]
MRTVLTVMELSSEHAQLEIVNNDVNMYSISVSEFENYVEENKAYMKNWLARNAYFPPQFIFTTYREEQVDEELMQRQIDFEHMVKGSRKDNIYILEVCTREQLLYLIDQYYWLAAENETMLIADSKSVIQIKERFITKLYSYITMEAEVHKGNGFVIAVEHDGQGMQLVTTKHEWIGLKNLQKTLGDIHLEQWNDTYYGL